jgi:hypothetical protein
MTKSSRRIRRAVAATGLAVAGSVGGFVVAGVPAANAATTHNSWSCPNSPEPTVIWSTKEAKQWVAQGNGPCTNTVTGKTLS